MAALLAGCGGAKTVSKDRLPDLVQKGPDLPRPFAPFYVGTQYRLDNQGTIRADPARWGREGGWIARYRRRGSIHTRGPLVLESRADLFSRAGGAEKDLAAYGAVFDQTPGATARRLRLPKLGDAALGIAFAQPGRLRIHFFRIAWRYRNVTASVTAEGFRVGLAQVLELARKQQGRIAA
jgi:hypothetical protein